MQKLVAWLYIVANIAAYIFIIAIVYIINSSSDKHDNLIIVIAPIGLTILLMISIRWGTKWWFGKDSDRDKFLTSIALTIGLSIVLGLPLNFVFFILSHNLQFHLSPYIDQLGVGLAGIVITSIIIQTLIQITNKQTTE